MRKLMIVLAMSLGSQAIAQQVPSVIKDLDYTKVELTTEGGELFDAFIVESDYKALRKRINKFDIVEVDREGSLLFVVREDDTHEYLVSKGSGFKRITIYKK